MIIKEIIFPDHYQYNKRDIKKIKSYAKNSGSKILTTEKISYSKLKIFFDQAITNQKITINTVFIGFPGFSIQNLVVVHCLTLVFIRFFFPCSCWVFLIT